MENLRKEEEEEEVLYFYRAERDSSPRRLNEMGGKTFLLTVISFLRFRGVARKISNNFEKLANDYDPMTRLL